MSSKKIRSHLLHILMSAAFLLFYINGFSVVIHHVLPLGNDQVCLSKLEQPAGSLFAFSPLMDEIEDSENQEHDDSTKGIRFYQEADIRCPEYSVVFRRQCDSVLTIRLPKRFLLYHAFKIPCC